VAEEGDRVTVAFEDEASADAAIRALLAAGGRLQAVTPHRETLEDFFVRRLEETREDAPADFQNVG
jgi:ABC-2 type transport system ATP-binding protein